jgi:hypothetical protein
MLWIEIGGIPGSTHQSQHNFGRNISGDMLAITYFVVLRSLSGMGWTAEADAAFTLQASVSSSTSPVMPWR